MGNKNAKTSKDLHARQNISTKQNCVGIYVLTCTEYIITILFKHWNGQNME